jgi:hypothetical protein
MQKPLIDNDGEARELTELDLKNAMPMRLRHSNMPRHVHAPQKTARKNNENDKKIKIYYYISYISF